MSTFFVMPPIAVTESNLTGTNVPEDDAPVWDIATTYNTDDAVISQHHVFTSKVDGNIGNLPTIGGDANWLDTGSTNRYKAFDQQIETQTVNADTVEFEITPGEAVGGLGAFNCAGSFVQAIGNHPIDGEVYNRTISLQDNDLITSWYAYFMSPLDFKTRAFFDDIPQYRDIVLTVIVDNAGGTAKVGAIALGVLRDLGITLFGTSFGIIDFSRKERDEFGNFSVVERGFADRISYDVVIDTASANRVKRVLRDARATPTVYVGSVNREETIVYGFYKDWTVVLGSAVQSSIAIEVEGLV